MNKDIFISHTWQKKTKRAEIIIRDTLSFNSLLEYNSENFNKQKFKKRK